MITKSERCFGIALGVGMGLLALSMLYTWSRFGLLVFATETFGVLLVLPPVIGVWIGGILARRGYFRRMQWIHVAIFIILGWPATLFLVPNIRIVHARRVSRSLPVYPNARIVGRDFEPFDSDGKAANVGVAAQIAASSAAREDILNFYRAQLPEYSLNLSCEFP